MLNARTPSILLIFCCFLPASLSASQYHESEAGQAFVSTMAQDYGFEAGRVEVLLRDAQRQDAVLEAISRPAEKTLEWHSYRKIFMKPERISQGLEFMAAYAAPLARAEREYGVPPEIVTAIIGVETWYGRYRGNYRVLDALATLAFDYPPRSQFFRSELEQYLLMTREQGLDPLSLKGSYAGAMGYGQFISSSYRHYAVDFDGDGVADILDNPVDAIGSVANYFSEHRWQHGEPVADQLDAELPANSALLTSGLKPNLTVSDYREAGLPVPDSVDDDLPARALRLNGGEGEGKHELWLTYRNFYVITRYNHSHLYAMAVYQLARALKSGEDLGGNRKDG
ncbi:lytic murein transglycosylase B [Marinobacter sp. CHS3-4]|uniref:lytic murein transglycosylase B n=1 Tax=Marinobacter sp. CHS3-4 TaxID=3045174 RepID=UPI0024B49356|nr:lytic murein transglycosylase B [Marinobacter sp. CHS3-4]MDI9246224.1 lytic murein transglycosylase B [Marinobacter sp. CHS3-4]